MDTDNTPFRADADNLHLVYAKDTYPKMHEVICTLIERSALENLIEDEPWRKDGQALGIKLAQHLHTLYRVAEETTLNHPSLDIRFVDFSSVHTLVRVVIETFIVYAYIYKCEDPSLAIFRHHTWELAGLMNRQGMKPVNQEQHAQLASEKLRIEVLSSGIQTSPYAGKNYKRLLRGDWRAGKSWAALGVEAGLHHHWLEHIYNQLSGHAHTSYISVLQVGQAPLADQSWLADIALSIGLEIMAHFAAIFSNNRRSAAEYLAEDEEAKRLVNFWRFTTGDYDKVYNPSVPDSILVAVPQWQPGDDASTRPTWNARVKTELRGLGLRWNH